MRRVFVLGLIVGASLWTSAAAQPGGPISRPCFALGGVSLAATPAGLEVLNVGPTGQDGVLLLPHPHTREMLVRVTPAPIPIPGVPAATTKVKAVWNVKDSLQHHADTMTCVSLPDGDLEVRFDYSDGAPISLTAEYHLQGATILVEEGLDPNPPGGASVRLRSGFGVAHNGVFSWRLQNTQPPRWGFNIEGDGWQTSRTIGGSDLQFDHVVVYAVGSPMRPHSISGLEIRSNAATSLALVEESVTIGDGCQADLTGDGLVDDEDFVEFARAYNDLLCP